VSNDVGVLHVTIVDASRTNQWRRASTLYATHYSGMPVIDNEGRFICVTSTKYKAMLSNGVNAFNYYFYFACLPLFDK